MAVATRSCARIRNIRGVKLRSDIMVWQSTPFGRSSLPTFAPLRYLWRSNPIVAFSARQCLVNRHQHLGGIKPVEALARAFEVALAPFVLARQAGQRVL